MERGVPRYGPQIPLGPPASLFYDKALRHLLQYGAGEGEEDHLAMAAANLMFLAHLEEHIARDALSPTLMDI